MEYFVYRKAKQKKLQKKLDIDIVSNKSVTRLKMPEG